MSQKCLPHCTGLLLSLPGVERQRIDIACSVEKGYETSSSKLDSRFVIALKFVNFSLNFILEVNATQVGNSSNTGGGQKGEPFCLCELQFEPSQGEL